MATFVIVHGGWGGGWEWTPVARLLRERGHEVFTPTLTGLGERAHLRTDVGLSDHITDVTAVFRFEELRDVVLCGHSYGGMVVSGVADRLPDAVRQIVYLDAFVPRHAESIVDLVSEEFRRFILELQHAGSATMPVPEEMMPPKGLIPEETRTRYVERLLPHPLRTSTEPISLSGAVERLPRAFVRCTGGEHTDPEPEMARYAERARADGWPYREIPTPHDLHLYDPEGTAGILHDLQRSKLT
jgi:pimeloyl-ACP methyl ester carboxylesterase